MKTDFHTHGKLAKYLPFSAEYTQWLFAEAKASGLDAICLTEHFNTQGFDEVYAYVEAAGDREGDAFVFNGLKVFPGMETDIREGGHILSIGPMDAIRELNRRLEGHKDKEHFLPFDELMELFGQYPMLVGAGHPFREGGHIPELPASSLSHFDFLDLNGKDIAEDRERTERLTGALARRIGKPVLAGSDTHQAVQYGAIATDFENGFSSFERMRQEIREGAYSISVHPEAGFKVRTANLLKRSLKEIDALGGDYISVLLGKWKGESPAVLAAKARIA